uniref:Transcription factor TGA1-like n=1 Tax=Rhizophora mucronata TaxID=61149 RepID=A0A2P2KIX4_RHIMU
MNSPSTEFVASAKMGIYESISHIGTWGKTNPEYMILTGNPGSSSSIIVAEMKQDNQSEDTSQGTLGPSNKFDQEASKPNERVKRRLAQNREAARKSRLRKKVGRVMP